LDMTLQPTGGNIMEVIGDKADAFLDFLSSLSEMSTRFSLRISVRDVDLEKLYRVIANITALTSLELKVKITGDNDFTWPDTPLKVPLNCEFKLQLVGRVDDQRPSDTHSLIDYLSTLTHTCTSPAVAIDMSGISSPPGISSPRLHVNLDQLASLCSISQRITKLAHLDLHVHADPGCSSISTQPHLILPHLSNIALYVHSALTDSDSDISWAGNLVSCLLLPFEGGKSSYDYLYFKSFKQTHLSCDGACNLLRKLRHHNVQVRSWLEIYSSAAPRGGDPQQQLEEKRLRECWKDAGGGNDGTEVYWLHQDDR